MKIALFSDIHSNLPALEAFFEDLEKTKPDAVYCLGDLVGYNIWPNEVIREIRKEAFPPSQEIMTLVWEEILMTVDAPIKQRLKKKWVFSPLP